jgi:starch synthase
MISRLDRQKGLDLLLKIIDTIIDLDVGLVILGAGNPLVQEALQNAVMRHPGHLCFRGGFDESLAHRIMAGADILLVPSRYEPCGLTQMYALKYGTVPIVRATGGLEDTIAAFNPETGDGTGFKFTRYEAREFLASIKEAIGFFDHTERWGKIMANGMKQDFSWQQSARQYLTVYRSVLGHDDQTNHAAPLQTR